MHAEEGAMRVNQNKYRDLGLGGFEKTILRGSRPVPSRLDREIGNVRVTEGKKYTQCSVLCII